MPFSINNRWHLIVCGLIGAALVFSVAACGPTTTDSRKSDKKETENDADGTDADEEKNEDEVTKTPPVVTKFITPVKALDPTVEGAYEFKVVFAEEPAGTTWSLYYSAT